MLRCTMLSQKFLLVVIASTLLVQRCSSDQPLSTLKTSSGRSAYLEAESKSSNTEITSDSFSHSDSSFAASQSENAQSDSSIVNTSDGISLQDSNSYSSNSSVSGSSSDIVAKDGFISQTESNFESSSSTTAESDTSVTATPNGTVMSSTTSSSTSSTSSSATTSRSVGGQFLDVSEADISFPDEDFPLFDSSHQTKSLDSIPDFPGNSPGPDQFPGFPNLSSTHQTKSLDSIPDFPSNSPGPDQFPDFPNSKLPPSLDSKPFPGPQNSKFPSNFPKFPNSLNNNLFKKYDSKNPYAPAGAFNSRLTPKIGTPVGPAGMSSPFLPPKNDNLLNSPDTSSPYPLPSNSPRSSLMNSEVDNSLPINSLPDNQFPSNIPTPESLQKPLNTPSPPITDMSDSPLNLSIPTPSDMHENLNSINDSQSISQPLDSTQPLTPDLLHDNLTSSGIPQPNSVAPTPSLGLQNSPLDVDVTKNDNFGILNSPIQPSDLSVNSLDNNVPIEFPSDVSNHTPELYDSSTNSRSPSPYDSLPKSPESDIHNELHPNMPSQISEFHDSTNFHSASPYDSYPVPTISSTDLSLDNNSPTMPSNSLHTPGLQIPSTDLLLDSTTGPYTSTHNPVSDSVSEVDSPFSHLQPQQPYDLLKKPLNSDDIPTPDAPYDTDLHPDDLTPSTNQYPTQILESMDTDQNGEISQDEVQESNIPSIPTTSNSMDLNQDGFISPEEILQSNTHIPIASESINFDQSGLISPEEILDSNYPTSTTPESTTTPESIDLNQNGLISPEKIQDSNYSTPTSGPMDFDQNGFVSTDEISKSNNPLSPSSTLFSLDNTDQLEFSDSPYLPPSYKDSPNLPDESSPIDQITSPYEQSPPLYQPGLGSARPKMPPHEKLPRPQQLYPPKPAYPDFKKPPFGPKHPLPLQNNFPSPPMGPYLPKYPPYPTKYPSYPTKYPPYLTKYPPYPPYFKPDSFNYPPVPVPQHSSPYSRPIIPPPYSYPESFLQPSSPLNNALMPSFYNPSPPISPINPLLNRPPYFYPESPFDAPTRPYYKPKDWSRIPVSKGPQYSSNTLSPTSPGSLDSLPYNQPLTNLPEDSLLPQSPNIYQLPSSPYSQPLVNLPADSFPPQSPDNYQLSPLSTSNLDSLPYNGPLTNSPPDSLLPQSPSDSLSSMQPLSSLDLDNSSPYTLPSSPQISADVFPSNPLDLNNNSPLTPLDSSVYPSQDLNTNLPSITPAYPPNTLLTSPSSIDDEIFDVLKQTYERTNDEYKLLSNSIYPRDISINFDVMTDEELTYNFVILGSSPAALSALKTLLDTGKSVLLVERGNLPPHVSHSLYYRPKILQSDYVRKIKSSAPHCDTEKILYVPNVLGEESTYDSNTWDYGVKSKYIKWGKLSKKWTWNNIMEYFTDGYDHPNTCSIPVTTEIENTRAVNAVTNIFNDAGLYRTDYQKGKRLEGLTVVPYLHENGNNVVLAEKIFQQLTSFSNIQLALETKPESIVFDNIGRAIGVVVKTPCGKTRTISITDELIIGSNPVDAVQFLYQSGIGDHNRLQQLNIPTRINLPYVGKELVITPLHFGVIYLFPQGTLLSETESDFAGTDYLFGKYGLPSALSVDYLKAALNIYGAHEANVIFNFRVFSKSMSERLRSYIERLKHIDAKIKDFLNNLCQDYDLLLAVPQLTNVLSRGEIIIDNSSGVFEALVDTGMYRSKRDITIMQKALKVLKSIAETETFKSLNGKVVQIPVEQCGEPDFSTEYNRCSIRYLSLPNLHCSGGTIMGVSPLTSVVNEDLLVHGTKNVRIFSASVVPYGTSTDSSAVSSMIGNLGAHILRQNYLQ